MSQPPPPPSLPPAGWYPDPEGPGKRYWDGRAWASPIPASPPTGKWKREEAIWRWAVIGVAVLFFGGCAALLASGSDNKRSTSTSSSGVSLAPGLTISPSELRDDAFMATIVQDGIPVADREGLLDTAHGVCPYLEIRGNTLPSLLAELMRERPTLTPAQVGTFARAAMDAFCPDKVP